MKKKTKREKEEFRFFGKNAGWLNNNLDYIQDMCDSTGVKLSNGIDGFGNKENLIVKKKAKVGKNGCYNESDVIARFSDAGRCHCFLSGMHALARLRKKKRNNKSVGVKTH